MLSHTRPEGVRVKPGSMLMWDRTEDMRHFERERLLDRDLSKSLVLIYLRHRLESKLLSHPRVDVCSPRYVANRMKRLARDGFATVRNEFEVA